MSKHFLKEFTCDRCGSVFTNSLTDEEVEAEIAVQAQNGMDVTDEACEIVCDICFKLDPTLHELAEQTQQYLKEHSAIH